ncbi:adenine phosphoribosyltransferase [Clostridium tarantellae]|uniref:Adenine phosphoribosyltransferase n=1 Tax=Clostridium tarantellae TaxID=39493 RepID=A0A6I1MLI9_9CLOT|nr:adenine phosphoribosyltransferase [Clostridium tarantellae]MPQ42987.1 adenine phosphoribosyltransferase [Clostridium tarantellae]
MNLKEKVRVIENFPKEGISFKDITTLIGDGEALRESVDEMTKFFKDKNIDVVVGPEARGFIFGVPVAYALGAGFVPVRKPGKLPGDTVKVEYFLEYGTDALEIHKDAIKPGARVAIIDDLLATGGTIAAVAKLVEEVGGEVIALSFAIELKDLNGKDKLKGYEVMSLLEYDI